MLTIADKTFSSHLFIGVGKYENYKIMAQAIEASGSQLITFPIKLIDMDNPNDPLLKPLKDMDVTLMPHTSGARTAQEAINVARAAREALGINWIKLEIDTDAKYLMPDPIETLKAAKILVEEGFTVLPYCHADPVLCKRLEDVGCAAVMPLASPIGTNKGLLTCDFLKIIIEQANIPVVIDAGIGAPSDAMLSMELGADAVLVNTAIAVANDPVAMASAFNQATEFGYVAYNAGLAQVSDYEVAPISQAEFIVELD